MDTEKPKVEQLKMGTKRAGHPLEALKIMGDNNVWNKQKETTLNINLRIKESTYKELIDLCDETGDIISVIARRGLYKEMARLRKELENKDERESDI